MVWFLLSLSGCAAPESRRVSPASQPHIENFRVHETAAGLPQKTISARRAILKADQVYQLDQVQIQISRPLARLTARAGHFENGTLGLSDTQLHFFSTVVAMPVLEWKRATPVLRAPRFHLAGSHLQQTGLNLRVDLKQKKIFAEKTRAHYIF